MTASLHTPLVPRPQLSDDVLARLRAVLDGDLRLHHAQQADHEQAVRQLADATDVDSVLERELAEAGAARAREAIEDIEHARRRIDLGTYGRCEACGSPMSLERLEAVPAARTCVACHGRASGLLRRPGAARRERRRSVVRGATGEPAAGR